jgi:glutathione S-transferase
MALILHYHPLSSYCWKALIALYEKKVEFEGRIIDFGDPASAQAFRTLWPAAKMPVLEDESAGISVPESSIVVEYLDRFHLGEGALLPDDPQAALRVRLLDRIFDLHVHQHMQKIIADRLRPKGEKDAYGVEEARRTLRASYAMLVERFPSAPWAAGETFSLADCAAAPALHYANKVEPFGSTQPELAEYLVRLEARPSFARVLAEAQPYSHMFPG